MELILIFFSIICIGYAFYERLERYKVVKEKLDLEDTIITSDSIKASLEEKLKHQITLTSLNSKVSETYAEECKKLEKELNSKNQIIENIQKLSIIGEQIKILPNNTVELVAKTTEDGSIFDIKGEQPKVLKRKYNRRNK